MAFVRLHRFLGSQLRAAHVGRLAFGAISALAVGVAGLALLHLPLARRLVELRDDGLLHQGRDEEDRLEQ